MNLRYCSGLLLLLSMLWALPTEAQQRGDQETRTVNGCEYEVVPGLAEVTSIRKVKNKEESILGYDHYKVSFRFIPMEGDVVLPTVPSENMEVELNSGQHDIPVGPQYINRYSLRKGNKYAMTLLQTASNRCQEGYFYESPAMPNDISEAQPNLNDYVQEVIANKYKQSERNAQQPVSSTPTTPQATPTETPKEKLSRKERRRLQEEQEEARKQREAKLQDSLAQVTADEKAAKEQAEREAQEKAAAEAAEQQKAAGSESGSVLPEDERARIRAEVRAELEAKRQADSIRTAKKRAEERAEQEKLLRELQKKKREEDLRRRQDSIRMAEQQRQELIEAERERIRREEEARIRKEEEERLRQKRLEEAIREMEIQALKRSSCEFAPKLSGVITIEGAQEVRSAEESPLGYTEYEVYVSFKPDNFADLSRKEKKFWREDFRFVLDPMGKSANPSDRYIREHRAYKGASFRGFARQKESGICTPVYFEAPDLPTSADEIRGEEAESEGND